MIEEKYRKITDTSLTVCTLGSGLRVSQLEQSLQETFIDYL